MKQQLHRNMGGKNNKNQWINLGGGTIGASNRQNAGRVEETSCVVSITTTKTKNTKTRRTEKVTDKERGSTKNKKIKRLHLKPCQSRNTKDTKHAPNNKITPKAKNSSFQSKVNCSTRFRKATEDKLIKAQIHQVIFGQLNAPKLYYFNELTNELL